MILTPVYIQQYLSTLMIVYELHLCSFLAVERSRQAQTPMQKVCCLPLTLASGYRHYPWVNSDKELLENLSMLADGFTVQTENTV